MHKLWLWATVVVAALATSGYVYATSGVTRDVAETCTAIAAACGK